MVSNKTVLAFPKESRSYLNEYIISYDKGVYYTPIEFIEATEIEEDMNPAEIYSYIVYAVKDSIANLKQMGISTPDENADDDSYNLFLMQEFLTLAE